MRARDFYRRLMVPLPPLARKLVNPVLAHSVDNAANRSTFDKSERIASGNGPDPGSRRDGTFLCLRKSNQQGALFQLHRWNL